jgi:hypothetical protein
MNRIMTAMALSAMFVAAPAFARKHADKPAVVSGDSKASDKAVAGDSKTETKTETKTDAAPADATAKPAKKAKKSKKVEKTTETAAPAAGSEAPATK